MTSKDAAEAPLFAQRAAIHQATKMKALGLDHIDDIPRQGGAEHALNKLARIFAGQMEALKRRHIKG